MKKLLRNNGLTLTLLGLFLGILIGQFFVGRQEYNGDREDHGQPPVSVGEYLTSGHFVEATFENWESEFLQMGMFVILTVFLFQKGSPESRDPDKEEEDVDADPNEQRHNPRAPWPVRRGGWVLKLYSHSLTLAFLLLFLVSFALHAAGGVVEYNEDQARLGKPPTSLVGYLGSSRFWFESLQNWQSEFLAIAAMVWLAVYLRQKGSPESKPVAAPHDQKGEEDEEGDGGDAPACGENPAGGHGAARPARDRHAAALSGV